MGEQRDMLRRRVIWLPVVLSVVAALACIDLGQLGALSAGEGAPNFEIETGDRTVTLEDLKGSVVVVSFWSST
jgi:hypothetical protein